MSLQDKQRGNILIYLFLIGLVFAGVAGGYYLGIKKTVIPIQTQQTNASQTPQSALTPAPSASPTDETANWKIYTDTRWGFSIKYPPTWNIKNAPADDPTIYITSDINAIYGNNPTLPESEVPFYVFMTGLSNPDHKTFSDLATQSYGKDIKNNFTYTKDSLNSYTVYKTDKLPSQIGVLYVYFTVDGSKYIMTNLAPYDSITPPKNQEKILPIFNRMLATFKFL